jgi:hypothetical protein
MLSFMGIGAQKCGTTWLDQTLRLDAAVAFHDGREVHHWDQPRQRSTVLYAQLFADDMHRNGDITPAAHRGDRAQSR